MEMNDRSGVGMVLRVAILVLLVAAGYQFWSGRPGSKPPLPTGTAPSPAVSSTPVPSSSPGSTPSDPPIAPTGGQARLATPEALPASAHANLLVGIQDLITRGSE